MIDLNNPPHYAYDVAGSQVEIEGIDVEKKLIFGRVVYSIFMGDHIGYVDELGPVQVWPVDRLFLDMEAAKKKVSEDVQQLDSKVKELQVEKRALEKEIAEAKISSKSLLEEATKWAGLEHLVNIISGKNMWCLEFVPSYHNNSPVIISKIEDALQYKDRHSHSSYQKHLKLLTLHGRTKGDLQWRIGEYPDDSGRSRKIWFFTTEQEAKDKAIELLHLSQQEGDKNQVEAFISRDGYLAGCLHLGIEPDPEIVKAIREAKIQAALNAVEAQKKSLQTAQDRLDELTKAADDLQKLQQATFAPMPPTCASI